MKAKAVELGVPFVVWMGVTNGPDRQVGFCAGESPTDVGLQTAIRYQGMIAAGEADINLVHAFVTYQRMMSEAGL